MAVGRCILWHWLQPHTLTNDYATDTEHAGHPAADGSADRGRSAARHAIYSRLGEYNRLARILREKQKQPADLHRSRRRAKSLSLCAPAVSGGRDLESLLGRGFLLSQAVERWNARAIWVVSRADATLPAPPQGAAQGRRSAGSLWMRGAAPSGNGRTGGRGSRHVDDELIAYTEMSGGSARKLIARSFPAGRKGIDRAAMHGHFRRVAMVAGVMADSLERAALGARQSGAVDGCTTGFDFSL